MSQLLHIKQSKNLEKRREKSLRFVFFLSVNNCFRFALIVWKTDLVFNAKCVSRCVCECFGLITDEQGFHFQKFFELIFSPFGYFLLFFEMSQSRIEYNTRGKGSKKSEWWALKSRKSGVGRRKHFWPKKKNHVTWTHSK